VETARLAGALGIRGTQAYVIGDQVISGAAGSTLLAGQIARTRSARPK